LERVEVLAQIQAAVRLSHPLHRPAAAAVQPLQVRPLKLVDQAAAGAKI